MDRLILPFILSQAAAWTGVALAFRSRRTAAILAVASALIAFTSLGVPSRSFEWLPFLHATISLRFDWASAVTLAASLLAILAPLAHGWLQKLDKRESDAAALACYASLLGLVYSWSIVLFYIYWELLVLASTALIVAWNRRLGIAYFAYMQVGSLLLLVAIGALLANGASTFSARAELGVLASTLAAVAFAVKLGVVPFHTWLPRVYTGLPEPVAAVVSGAVTGAGAYGFYRFSIFIPSNVAAKLFWLGAISAAVGALVALASNRLAEIAAYSSIGHSGFAFAGIAAGGLASAGALYLTAGHMVVKPLYFLVSDIVHRLSGRDDIRRLGMLARTMPLTAFAGFVAALSLAGAPVFALFPGEVAAVVGSAKSLGVHAAGWLATAAFLSACYAARFWLRVFWHPPVMVSYRLPSEPPAATLAPMMVLAAAALAIGAVGGAVIPHLTP